LQQELLLDGARHFDVDDSGQVLIVARKPARIGGSHILTKVFSCLLLALCFWRLKVVSDFHVSVVLQVSLFSPQEQDDMQLPLSIKAVRDLHLSPFGRLALLASMGKKLSVVRCASN